MNWVAGLATGGGPVPVVPPNLRPRLLVRVIASAGSLAFIGLAVCAEQAVIDRLAAAPGPGHLGPPAQPQRLGSLDPPRRR